MFIPMFPYWTITIMSAIASFDYGVAQDKSITSHHHFSLNLIKCLNFSVIIYFQVRATVPSPPPPGVRPSQRVSRHLRWLVQVPGLLRLQVLWRPAGVPCPLSPHSSSSVRRRSKKSDLWRRRQRLVYDVRVWRRRRLILM